MESECGAWRSARLALASVLIAIGVSHNVCAQEPMPLLNGSWAIKDVRFGNGAMGNPVATSDQREQLYLRVGQVHRINGTCAQGGPKLTLERTLIPEAEITRPESNRLKWLASLGLTSRGQGILQFALMCGNAAAGVYY